MNAAPPTNIPITAKRSNLLRRRITVALLLTAAVSILMLGLLLRKPRDFYWSGQRLSLSIDAISPGGPFARDGLIVHEGWDGPTGEFSHGDIFGLKFGRRMLRLDVVYDPIAAIKRNLPTTVPGLVKALSSQEPHVARCAAEALIKLGPLAESAMPALLNETRAPKMDWAILELAKTGGSTVVPHLIQALDSTAAHVRQISGEALGEIGTEATNAIPSLTKSLHDSNLFVAISSALALRKIEKRNHGEVAKLISFLENPDPPVRTAAIVALGEFGEDAADSVETLVGFLKLPDPETAGLAAKTLGRIGKPAASAVPRLIELLESENQLTRTFAMEALGALGDSAKAAVPRLMKLAERREDQFAAVSALATMGPVAAAGLTELYRKGKTGNYAVAKALMRQGPHAATAVPLLRDELKSAQPKAVILAAMTLGKIGPAARTAIPDLAEALQKSEDPHVRVRVAEALWRLDHQTNTVLPVMVAELDTWSKQPNPLRSQRTDSYGQSRQLIAVEVLREIGPAAAEAVPFLKMMRGSSFEEQRTAAAKALESILAP